MGRTPMPPEQFDELASHREAIHHPNRVVKHQSSGKKLRMEKRHRGVPKCPDCHQVVSRCECWEGTV